MTFCSDKKNHDISRSRLFLFSIILSSVMLTRVAEATTDVDPCEQWADSDQNQCEKCSTGHILALLSEDRVFCAQADDESKCTLASFYLARENNPVEDPDNLQLYIVSGEPDDIQFCYSCTSSDSDNGSQFSNCKKCGDMIDGSESANTAATLQSSAGCAVCQDGFYPQVEAHPVFPDYLLKRECVSHETTVDLNGHLCDWGSVYGYDPGFNEEYLSHDGSVVCTECSDVIPGCSWCQSGNICLQCDPDAFSVTTLTSYGSSLGCFYDFCGFGKGILRPENACKDCTIDNCNECAFDSGDETCLRCEPAYDLSTIDQKTCALRENVGIIDLFVVSFTGLKMDGITYPTLASQQSTSSTFGESMSEPYAFLQQALNQVASAKSLGQFESAEVTVHLGKGTHFFFACVDGLSADVSALSDVTDFCGEIDSLKQVYARADNVKLTVKPLDCSLDTAATQASPVTFTENCVDTEAVVSEHPTVVINSASVNFNVTNEAVFEDIIFTGNDNLAFYSEAPNKGRPIEEFPIQFCDQTFDEDSHHAYEVVSKAIVQFGFDCVRPQDLSPDATTHYPSTRSRCSPSLSTRDAKQACSAGGEPYSSDFFTLHGGYLAERRRVLFNLYAFDDLHTAVRKTPSLTIRRCKFSHFMSGKHEALIQVETNNLYPVHFEPDAIDGRGYLKQLGADNGAAILIEDSEFEFSRFCKGLIVYREGVDYQESNTGVLGYQKEASGDFSDYDCAECQIVLKGSTFRHLNHGTELRTLRPLLDFNPSVRNSTKLDSSGLTAGAITAPLFQNFGSVLNLQDFRGPIEIKDCTLSQNLVNVPDIFEDVSTLIGDDHIGIDHENLNFYLNQITNVYELAICEQGQEKEQDVYFLKSGIQPYLDLRLGLATLFNRFERHSGAIYISRPTKPVLFIENSFKENIGLFGGAVIINSPNFQAMNTAADSDDDATVKADMLPHIVLHKNDFTRNMAYMSGNAVFVQGTKAIKNPLQACMTGVLATSNTFRDNFGFKISDGGAMSLACSAVTDENNVDFHRSSGVTTASLSSKDDLASSSIHDLVDSDKTYTPYKRSAYLYENEFTNNHAGRKGSAIYIKGVSDVIIDSNGFTKNKAVDVLEEKRFVPAYAKYFLGVDAVDPSTFRSFSLVVDADEASKCGQTEIDYLARCADSKTVIPQSILQGTVYYEGGQVIHCDPTQCRDETLLIKESNFEGNEINYNYQWVDEETDIGVNVKHQASVIFIQDARQADINLCSFKLHQKSSTLKDYLKENLEDFYDKFPADYFTSSHVSLVRVEQSDQIGLDLPFEVTFSKNTFDNNLGFQLLGFGPESYYRGSLVHAVSLDQVVNNRFIFKLNDIYTCKTIGPETSLVYIKDARYAQVFGNHPRYNGYASTDEFESPIFAFTPRGSVTQQIEKVSFLYAQYYGVFFFDTVVEVQAEGNSFEWCGAVWGTGFFNFNSVYRGWYNSFKYMVAVNGGAVMRSVGVDIRQAINSETTSYTLGVAYDFEGGAEFEDQISMFFMKNIIMTNCVGAKVGFLRFVRSGGIQCNQCDLSYKAGFGTFTAISAFRNGPQKSKGIFKEDYPVQQLADNFNEIAPVMVTASQYQGSAYNFTIGEESFQASPITRPDYLWFKNCEFKMLVGGISGVFFVENSNVYFSNVDGTLTRRLDENYADQDQDLDFGLEDDPAWLEQDEFYDERRHLEPSIFISEENTGKIGAGFVYAIGQSQIILRGQNLQRNSGVEGGVVSLRESKLLVEHTYAIGQSSLSHGGFLAAVNSHFHIEKSVISRSTGQNGCVIYSSGVNRNFDQESLIALTNFKENNCTASLFQLVNSNLKIDQTRFVDNNLKNNTGAISAISSYLDLNRLEVYNTDLVPEKKDIQAQVGFLTLLEGTEMILQLSRFQRTYGTVAGIVYSRGPNNVIIASTDFESCLTSNPSGALLDFEGAESVQIYGVNFFKNEGAPVVRATRSDIKVVNSQFRQTEEANFITAIDSNLEIRKGTFFQGGNDDLLGGAIHWQGNTLSIFDSAFQENRAASGGALYVTGIGTQTNIDVRNSDFVGNKAQQGGALAIKTAQKMKVLNNKFQFNKAELIEPQTITSAQLPSRKAQGGAIYSLCIEAYAQECEVQLLGNTFKNNMAQDGGGATIWLNKPFIDYVNQNLIEEVLEVDDDLDEGEASPVDPGDTEENKEDTDAAEETIPDTGPDAENDKDPFYVDDDIEGGDLVPVLDDETADQESSENVDNEYVDNSQEYDDDEQGSASYAKLLIFNSISNNDPKEVDDEARRNALTFDSFKVVSGTPLTFTISITDHNGVIVTDSSTATAQISVESYDYEKSVNVIGNRVFAVDGILDFTGFTIITEPDSNIQVKLRVNLESQIDGTDLFAQDQIIDVFVRPCLDGEQYTMANMCVPCPPGTYLMIATSVMESCKQCEPNGLCFGEDKIAPTDAYWSPNTQTVKFLACINPESCLKGDAEHLTGRCAPNYKGPLCSQCADGFYLSGAGHKCNECYNTDLKVRFIALTLFFILLVAIGAVLATLSNSLIEIRPLNFIPAAIKILATHLQLVFVFARIQQRSVPSQLLTEIFLLLQTPLVDEYRKITLCWLQDSDQNSSWIQGERLVWMLMPLGVFLMAVLLLTLILFLLKRLNSWSYQVYQLAVVAFFMVHIEVAFQILTSFDCVDLLGERVLADDLERICFSQSDSSDGDHLKFILSLCLPFGLLWICITPIALFLHSRFQKTQIQELFASNWRISNLAIQEQVSLQRTHFLFGFTLNGLRKQTYLWDSVTILRNIGFIGIYVTLHAFSYQQESIMLGLICYLIPFLLVQVKIKPYEPQLLNHLESLSMIVLIFYLLNELQEAAKAQSERREESFVLAIAFVVIPTLVFSILLLKFLREQVLSMVFYMSMRLFKILSCGARSVELYAHNKIVDYQRNADASDAANIDNSLSVSNLSVVADHQKVRLNFKRIETTKAKSISGKIMQVGSKRSRTAVKSGRRHPNTAIQLISKSEQKGKYNASRDLALQSSISEMVSARKDTQGRLETRLDFNDTQNLMTRNTYTREENVAQAFNSGRKKDVLMSNLHAKGKQKNRRLISENDSDQGGETIEFHGFSARKGGNESREALDRAKTRMNDSSVTGNVSLSRTIADDPLPGIGINNVMLKSENTITGALNSARRSRMPIIDAVTNSVVLNSGAVGNGMFKVDRQNSHFKDLDKRQASELLTPENRSEIEDSMKSTIQNLAPARDDIENRLLNVIQARNEQGLPTDPMNLPAERRAAARDPRSGLLTGGANSAAPLATNGVNDPYMPKFTQSRNFGDTVLRYNQLNVKRQQTLDQTRVAAGANQRLKRDIFNLPPIENQQIRKSLMGSYGGKKNIFADDNDDDDVDVLSQDDSEKIYENYKSSTFKTIKESDENANVSNSNSAINSYVKKPEEKNIKHEKDDF